jgi:hypothetical protein
MLEIMVPSVSLKPPDKALLLPRPQLPSNYPATAPRSSASRTIIGIDMQLSYPAAATNGYRR